MQAIQLTPCSGEGVSDGRVLVDLRNGVDKGLSDLVVSLEPEDERGRGLCGPRLDGYAQD